MQIEDLNVYAFNPEEKHILCEKATNGELNLSFKDIKIYFQLKSCGHAITVTNLVKKCLLEKNTDINSAELFKPRKKENKDEYYTKETFKGNDEFRVDSYSRALNKLLKLGLVTKNKTNAGHEFETVIKY